MKSSIRFCSAGASRGAVRRLPGLRRGRRHERRHEHRDDGRRLHRIDSSCADARDDRPTAAATAVRDRVIAANASGVSDCEAIALRGRWIAVHFHQQAIGADRDGRERQRRHHPRVARAVAGIDEDGQMRAPLQHRHGAEVQRAARRRLERPDPALAEDHLLVAAFEDVFGGLQVLVNRRAHAALEQHRDAQAADLLEQRVVLHVARTDLQRVGHGNRGRWRASITSVRTGRPVSSRARPAAAGLPPSIPGSCRATFSA